MLIPFIPCLRIPMFAYPDADPYGIILIMIVYRLGDWKLINAYLTKNNIQNINLQNDIFENLKSCIVKCTSTC